MGGVCGAGLQSNTGQGSAGSGGWWLCEGVLLSWIKHCGRPGEPGLLRGRSGQECRTPEGFELRFHLHQTNPKQISALHLDLGPGSATDQQSNFGKVASFFRFSFLV